MNEKGFATIFGLCLILIIALVVKGIEEAEMNHAYETANFQAEFELQNAADSGIYVAAKKIRSGEIDVPVSNSPYKRKTNRTPFPIMTVTSNRFGTITVEVWSEHLGLKPYYTDYPRKRRKRDKNRAAQEVYTFFSVASADSIRPGEKIYRRAFAYMPKDINEIHFMEVPQNEYLFEH